MTLDIFLSHIEYILQLSLVKFSVSLTFFGTDGTGQTDIRMDRHTDGRTHGHMDRETFLGKYYFRYKNHAILSKLYNFYPIDRLSLGTKCCQFYKIL